MPKKPKDNIFFILALLFGTIVLASALTAAGANPFLLLGSAALVIVALARVSKVARKDILEYLNGPKRFCKGRGIEIGSGANRMLKDSLLVDVVDDFSSAHAYEVDYRADAHDLAEIPDGSLDYVCASHVLEHLTNPVKAILELLRVLKAGGTIWLRIPDKRTTFDRPRQRTALGHLIEDYRKNVPPDDPTHIDDNNATTDPPRQQAHPYVHNHVWIPEDITELFGYINAGHVPLSVVRCGENTCRHAQDFWVVIKKI